MKAKLVERYLVDRKEFEKRFMKLYETGISTTEICERLGENRSRGYSLLRRKGMKSNPYQSKIYTKEVIQSLAQEYIKGATVERLQEKYPEYAGHVNNYLRKLGVTRSRGTISNCNPNYFSKIDTPQKAYFLGLLFADGCIVEKKTNHCKTLRIGLKVEDGYIIEEFAKAIGSTKGVKFYKNDNRTTTVNGKLYHIAKNECYFAVGNKIDTRFM